MPATTTSPLPRGVDDLDPEWLTAALRGAGALDADASVTGVRAERIALDTGFSSELHRLHLSGAPGAPETLVAKLPTTTAVRDAMDLVGGYEREVAFYRDVAPHAPIGCARAYVAELAPDSTDFVLLLEDLGAWENASHLDGLGLDRARTCLQELAGLHRWSAGREDLDAFGLLDRPVTRQAFPALFAEGWAVTREVARRPLPPAVVAFGETFAERSGRALELLVERPALVNGDVRADNLFFRGDRMKVVDFQLTTRAAGAADVAYLVSQGLTTEQRDGRDEELVREYLDARGDDDFDATWREYRAATAFSLVYPVIAMRGWELLPEGARELLLRLVERSVACIEDVEALEVLA